MGKPLFHAYYNDTNLDRHQTQQVGVVHLYEDGERVEILYKRRLITVKKSELTWASWE